MSRFDEKGEGHAVLTLITDRGDLVLDNKTNAILPWQRTGYTYVKREGQDGLAWVSLNGVASPITTAAAGSMHGYDVIDPTTINPELGGEAAFRSLVAALKARDMGLIIDIVPNHMGVAGGGNAWWNDVLARGQDSEHARVFDIDWSRPILLPVLGGTLDTSASVVAAGALISDTAMKTGVIVKFSQNALIGVAALALAIWWAFKLRQQTGETPSASVIWERFPKFVIGFVIASALFSFFLAPELVNGTKGALAEIRTWWFALAFVSIGLETRFVDLATQAGLLR